MTYGVKVGTIPNVKICTLFSRPSFGTEGSKPICAEECMQNNYILCPMCITKMTYGVKLGTVSNSMYQKLVVLPIF